MENNNVKFRKHETFYIREGWLEKAINTIADKQPENIFAKNKGGLVLGIGANMAKALRYWLQAALIIKSSATKTVLSEFGQLLLEHDRYLETPFSWFMIHYMLSTNYQECPVFNTFFNSPFKAIKRQDIAQSLQIILQSKGVNAKLQTIEEDVAIFLKTYMGDEPLDNPEDNYICPLATLKLLSKKGDKVERVKPKAQSLSPLIILYALETNENNKPFNIEDQFQQDNSPIALFNLDKNLFLQYLESLRKEGFITINKTAGLNTVYFEKILSLKDLFEIHFGGNNYVF